MLIAWPFRWQISYPPSGSRGQKSPTPRPADIPGENITANRKIYSLLPCDVDLCRALGKPFGPPLRNKQTDCSITVVSSSTTSKSATSDSPTVALFGSKMRMWSLIIPSVVNSARKNASAEARWARPAPAEITQTSRQDGIPYGLARSPANTAKMIVDQM
jgi:hypothetical protein